MCRRTAGVGFHGQQPGPVPHHADLAERERDEHADDVELDQRGDLSLERDDERDRREGQEQDAVGERQPVTAGVQLTGQVAVLGQDRAQHREAVEGGVGGQHQDERGDACDQVEPEREVVEDRVGELRDQRLLVVVGRGADQLLVRPLGDLHAGLLGQHDDAHEQRDRDDAQQQQRRCGVAGLRLSERGHPVADGLHARQGRAAGRERARHQEHHRESHDVAVLGLHIELRRLGLQRDAEHIDLEQAPAEHDVHADHEGIRRNRERGAGLAEAPQVRRCQEQDREDGEQHLVRVDERHRGPDVGHRRRHRNRDGEHVVHQQRAGHGQPGGRAEVGGHHLVVATARRIRVHVLPVAGDHDQHHRPDGQPDPRRHRDTRPGRPPTAPGRFPRGHTPPTTARRKRRPAGLSAWARGCGKACRCGRACRGPAAGRRSKAWTREPRVSPDVFGCSVPSAQI